MKSWESLGKGLSGQTPLFRSSHWNMLRGETFADGYSEISEVHKARSRTTGAIVALKKILMHNEKDGVSSFESWEFLVRGLRLGLVSDYGSA